MVSAALGLSIAQAETLPTEPITPKVLVVTMFGGEAKPWQEHLNFSHAYQFPWLSEAYPDLQCDEQGVCLATTAMGYANAASTMSALALSDPFRFTSDVYHYLRYWGVDPNDATLGSANWARYVVDGGLIHRIDSRQIPSAWKTGILALGATEPGKKGRWSAGTSKSFTLTICWWTKRISSQNQCRFLMVTSPEISETI
ncbi:hypothetical protein P4S72_15345 [Vibrio sp. PP-XX7]